MKPQINKRAATTHSTAATITKSWLTEPGDILILFIIHKAADYISTPEGWTLIAREQVGTVTVLRAEVYWKRAGESEPAYYTIDGLTSSSMCLASYSNCVKEGNPIDGYSIRANTDSPDTGTNSIETTTDNCAIIFLQGINANISISAFTAAGVPGLYTETNLGAGSGSAVRRIGYAHAMKVGQGQTGDLVCTLASTWAANIGIGIALKPDPTMDDLTYDVLLSDDYGNNTAGSAYELQPDNGRMGRTIIIQDVSESLPPQVRWFKYVPQEGENAMGYYVWANSLFAGKYYAVVDVYYGDDPDNLTAAYTGLGRFDGLTTQRFIPFLPGEEYYFRVYNGKPSASTDQSGVEFRIQFHPAPQEETEKGDLLINDDRATFPLGVMSKETGEMKSFLNPFPAGERGDMLVSGESLWLEYVYGDDTYYRLHLYDHQFNLISTHTVQVVTEMDNYLPEIRCGRASKFYIAEPAIDESGWGWISPITIYTIDKTGQIGEKTWEIPIAIEEAILMSVNPDETILYWAQYYETTIHRWDLVADEAMSDLPVTFPGNREISGWTDMLVMADGSIVVPVVLSSARPREVILRYSPDGTLLNTYQFIGENDEAELGDETIHIALDSDDGCFWTWMTSPSFLMPGFIFRKVNADTGDIETEFYRLKRSGSDTGHQTSNTDPLQEFANSVSCPLIIMQYGFSPGVETYLTVRALLYSKMRKIDPAIPPIICGLAGCYPETVIRANDNPSAVLGINPYITATLRVENRPAADVICRLQ